MVNSPERWGSWLGCFRSRHPSIAPVERFAGRDPRGSTGRQLTDAREDASGLRGRKVRFRSTGPEEPSTSHRPPDHPAARRHPGRWRVTRIALGSAITGRATRRRSGKMPAERTRRASCRGIAPSAASEAKLPAAARTAGRWARTPTVLAEVVLGTFATISLKSESLLADSPIALYLGVCSLPKTVDREATESEESSIRRLTCSIVGR